MSFHITATGSHGFTYSRRSCADGDVFEATAVMSALAAASPSRVGVGEGVADYVLPSTASEARESAQAHGATIWSERLRQGFAMLASNESAAQGWISVTAIQYDVGIRRSSLNRRFNFSSGHPDPPAAFMRTTVIPVLTHTRMNNYGVLREIANAIWAYRVHIGGGGPPMLQIQLQG